MKKLNKRNFRKEMILLSEIMEDIIKLEMHNETSYGSNGFSKEYETYLNTFNVKKYINKQLKIYHDPS